MGFSNFHIMQVVTALQNDSAFLSELFAKLRSPDTPERSRRDLVSVTPSVISSVDKCHLCG